MSRARSGTVLALVGTGLTEVGWLLRQSASLVVADVAALGWALLAVVVFTTGIVLGALGLWRLLSAGWYARGRRGVVLSAEAPGDGSVWPPAPKGPSAQ